MRDYLRFMGLMRKELYGVVFGVFMSFIASLSSVALMGTATWFLSAMAVAGFYDYALNIFIPSALIRLLALARTLLRYGERYYTHDATFRLLAYLRVFLFERALALEVTDALRFKSADLQRRMQADLERLEMLYIRQFVPFACAVLMGLVLGGMLISFSWHLALTCFSLMLIAAVIAPVVATYRGRRYSTLQSTLAIKLNDEVSELIAGFFDLMLLGQHFERAAAFLRHSQQLAWARSRILFYDQVAQVVLLTCSELTLLLLLIESVPLVQAGAMSSPQMMMLGVVAMASYELLQPLSAACLNLPYVLHSAQRVAELFKIGNASLSLEAVTTLQADDSATSATSAARATSDAAAYAASGGQLAAMSSFGASDRLNDQQAAMPVAAAGDALVVRLEHVAFSYALEGAQRLSLYQDLTLELRSDQNYLIKAPSGRGKSTLVLLLTKLLTPQAGRLSLNGTDYAQLSGAAVRAHFAVALQDITLFSGTIFETFRQIKPEVTEAEVKAALHLVELTELIAQLPQGLDEWLGSTGLTISGGQARRLCLARALVKAGCFSAQGQEVASLGPAANFLVLDEPGEGLDEAQEARIIERIQALRKGVIIITHKQAGTRLSDHLVTL
ncbi:MAG TPA: ATP-binding cassette domain-containing protein [Candidatus Anaerobiospirillum stercoravium]|nr:ATP-binding cassette domain-containing protein [Candidatus Anaerobiospirillum stercoravium]